MHVRTLAAAVALAGAAVLGGATLASADNGSRTLLDAVGGPTTGSAPSCLADLSVVVDPGVLRCSQ
ncbi:hypothetical protein AB0C96_22160 [Streptomyces sp. NPDC048506]|uniref:hypothetical protein n=1 Tax=Streptomyces sp. NPDC048506 TaxID=3155028 RepID=UPI003443C130